MAPPRNRRPGFSRRIQLGLFLGYVVAVVGAVLSLGLVLISRVDPSGFAQIRGLAIDAGTGIGSTGRWVVRGASSLESDISRYFFAARQNEKLRQELAAARREMIAADTIRLENERLKRTLKLVEQQPDVVVTARLVGSGLSSPRRFATIFAGSKQGIRPGQPVRAAEGLIGRILETGATASRVLLITDTDSAVPVRLTRSGTPALARGRGDGTIRISALFPGAKPFRQGDITVTSGTGGIYSPNIPVAVIAKVDGDSAIAWPLAHPDELDFAVVMRPYVAATSPGLR